MNSGIRTGFELKLSSIRNRFLGEFVSNQRLQRMIWAIAYIIVFYFILALNDEVKLVALEARTESKNLQRLTAYDSTADWDEYRTREELVTDKLSQQLWRARTPGLASADLQTFLQEAVRKYEISNFRLKLGEPKPLSLGEATVWLIQAELIGKIARKQLPRMLADLESGDRSLSIDRLTFSPVRGNLLNMLVSIRSKDGSL